MSDCGTIMNNFCSFFQWVVWFTSFQLLCTKTTHCNADNFIFIFVFSAVFLELFGGARDRNFGISRNSFLPSDTLPNHVTCGKTQVFHCYSSSISLLRSFLQLTCTHNTYNFSCWLQNVHGSALYPIHWNGTQNKSGCTLKELFL